MLEISQDCNDIVMSLQKIGLPRDKSVTPLKFDRL